MTRARARTAGGRAFYDIGPGPHDPADDRTDIRQAVDDAIREQRVIGHATDKAGRADRVADPTDWRDNTERDDEPWPRDQAFVDRPLKPGIEPSRIAHRSVAAGEGVRQYFG